MMQNKLRLQKRTRGWATLLLVALLLRIAGGAGRAQELKIGQTAPDFALPDETGKVNRLADYKGRTVILMFYPKDFTPGCTCQMRSLRPQMAQLRNRNVIVFGISVATVALHRDFARHEELNFPLLADADKAVTKAYGALGKNDRPRRVTFIIGPDGAIHGIDGAVDAEFERQGNTLISHHGENLALLFSDWNARTGSSVPFFYLPDASGKTVSSGGPGSKARVLLLFDTKSVGSQSSMDSVALLASNPIYKEVSFFGIDADAPASRKGMQTFAVSHPMPFPLATDFYQETLPHLEAHNTPMAWVLNSRGQVVYRGAILGVSRAGKEVNYVKEALNAVLSGRPLSVQETPTTGMPLPD